MQGIAVGRIDPAALLIGLASLAVTIELRFVLGGRIPDVLVAVVAAIVVTAIFSLQNVVPVVVGMPQKLPAPALGIALIAFTDTGVLSRTLAARRGENVNGSQEMAGLALANIGGARPGTTTGGPGVYSARIKPQSTQSCRAHAHSDSWMPPRAGGFRQPRECCR